MTPFQWRYLFACSAVTVSIVCLAIMTAVTP